MLVQHQFHKLVTYFFDTYLSLSSDSGGFQHRRWEHPFLLQRRTEMMQPKFQTTSLTWHIKRDASTLTISVIGSTFNRAVVLTIHFKILERSFWREVTVSSFGVVRFYSSWGRHHIGCYSSFGHSCQRHYKVLVSDSWHSLRMRNLHLPTFHRTTASVIQVIFVFR